MKSAQNGVVMKGIEQYREQYPKGAVLRLTGDLDDPYRPKKAGEVCVVDYIDDGGNIHVRWKSGGTLSLIIGVDSFEKV